MGLGLPRCPRCHNYTMQPMVEVESYHSMALSGKLRRNRTEIMCCKHCGHKVKPYPGAQ